MQRYEDKSLKEIVHKCLKNALQLILVITNTKSKTEMHLFMISILRNFGYSAIWWLNFTLELLVSAV